MMYRSDALPPRHRLKPNSSETEPMLAGRWFVNERNKVMAMKTTNIEVKVDEQLAAAIADKAVKQWHATSFSNGKRRVYVTFEEVKTVGA